MKTFFRYFIFLLAIIFGAGLATYGFYIGAPDPAIKGGFAFGGGFLFLASIVSFLIYVLNEDGNF